MSDITNPLLIEIPPSIETDRLVLREPCLDDAPEINQAVVQSIEALRPWMEWAATTPTLADTIEYCRRSAAQAILRQQIEYRIRLKEGGLFAGHINLFNIDWKVPRFEIGYWLRASLCRRGYMTEAVKALTAFSFDRLNAVRVEIKTDNRNQRSWRVAERAGFALEGTIRNDMRLADGTLRDTRVYSRIRQ